MKRKFLLFSLVAVTVLTVTTGCGCEKKEKNKDKELVENEVIINQEQDVIKDQKLEVFTFTNTSLIYEVANSRSTLETIVTNTSNVDQKLNEFRIKVYDKENNLIIDMPGFVGDVIKAKESRTISSYCGEDLSKATKIEYSVVK